MKEKSIRMRRKLLIFVNLLLSPTGFEIKRYPTYYHDIKQYLKESKRSDITLCEYMEKEWNAAGLVDFVMNRLGDLGALESCREIVEIGPGSGVYLERHMLKNRPDKYHIFEIDKGCRNYLAKTNKKIIAHPADGHSLSGLKDETCGLCVAHGVLVYLPFLNCFRYFRELIRVCKTGGYIAFDIYSDIEWNLKVLDAWMPLLEHSWPVVLPENKVTDYFLNNGCTLIGRFHAQSGFDFSTYLVFKKR